MRSVVGPLQDRAAAHRPDLTIGVLGFQGSFPLHLEALARLGVASRRVVKPDALEGLNGLVLPGGESTVLSLLAQEYKLFEPLQKLAGDGLPMFGTCAGAILLGRGTQPPRLEVAPVQVRRNAYGSQLESFTAALNLTPFTEPFHGVFIRAPILEVAPEMVEPGESPMAPQVLGVHSDHPVLIQCGNVLLSTFHPELTTDDRLHRYFVNLCSSHRERTARRR